MSLRWSLRRVGRPLGRAGKLTTERAQERRMSALAEVLEDRQLLAITSPLLIPNIAAIESQSFTGLIGHFTSNDPNPQNAANYTASINWQDGTTSPGTVTASGGGGFDISGTHTYAEDGVYTPVIVTINDLVDSTQTVSTTKATVGEFSLSATGVNVAAPENLPLTNVTVGTFSDPGSIDLASAYTASISWGDGTTSAGTVSGAAGAYTVGGSHTYVDEGSYSISTTFFETNEPGFTITSSSTATVTEADIFSGGAVVVPAGTTENSQINGTVATFNDLGYPMNPAGDFTASISWGDGTTSAGTVVALASPVGSFAVNGSHTYNRPGTFPFSATVTDNAPGTASITISGPFVVADAPLTAKSVTVNGTEGAPLTNVDVATFTDADPLSVAGDFVASVAWGDGTTSAGTVVRDSAGTFHVEGSHTYTEESSTPYAVAVTIADVSGGRAVTDPTVSQAAVAGSANIKQAPLLAVGGAVAATAGTAVPAATPLATFTDTGGADPVSDYTATINWGDGSAPAAGLVSLSGNGGNFVVTSAAPHTYAGSGNFVFSVTIQDTDPTNPGAIPTTATATGTAAVAAVALTPAATQPVVPAAGSTLDEGRLFSGPVAAFTDPNPAAPLSGYSATIDWGDGSPTSLGTFTRDPVSRLLTVNGQHIYKQSGSFTVTVVTTDSGGKPITTTTAATVADPALTGATALPQKAVEGQAGSPVVLATFTDPNPYSTVHDWNATVNFGDGGPAVAAAVVLAGGDPVSGGNIFQVVASHTFGDEGPLSPGGPAVTITDVGNPSATPTVLPLSLTVVDAPLTPHGATVQAVEGVAFTQQLVATFTDANPGATAADFTTGTGSVTIFWGDGTTSAGTAVPAGGPDGVVFSIFGSHTYAEEGTYQVTVQVADRGGSQTVANSQAVVADARLTASAAQPTVNSTEGVKFTLPVAAFTDADAAAELSDFVATIDWGDGTPQSAGTVGQPGGPGTEFLVTGTHTYADAGVNGGTGHFPITVYVSDAGGSKLTAANTANVADVAITLTGALSPLSDSGRSHFDAVTNVSQPVFLGKSEPFSHVTLLGRSTAGGGYFVIGQTQAGSDGSWQITSRRLPDGSYTIAGTAIDRFGKTTTGFTLPPTAVQFLPNAGQGPLVIDTVGPQVTNVFFNRLNGEVDVFFRDDRSGLTQSTLLDAANYQLTKPHTQAAAFLVTGLNVVTSPVSPTGVEEVRVVFNGGKALRGGFYTFTIRDSSRGPSSVQDVAGNSLDGEFYGSFPSGNGIPGGDFVAMLDAFHNKVFAPQTVVGTASAANGGQGGLPAGAPHGGVFTPVVPRGSVPIFTTNAFTNRPFVRQAGVILKSVPRRPR